MDQFLAVLLAYPTVVWTVLVGVCMLFWAFVIVGAADMDIVSGKAEGALSGAVKGGAEALGGAMKGGAEALGGVMKGGVEAAAKGGAEAAAEAAGSSSSVAELLGFLKLDRAPVTITASFFSLFGWMLSFIGGSYLGGGALVGTGVFAASAVGSLLLTSLASRPFGVIFDEKTRHGGHVLVGKTVIVRSGKVDEKGGQAELDERGASLVVDVRTAGPAIGKGQEVVVVEYDEAADCYIVAPMTGLLEAREDAARDEAARAQMISRPVEALVERRENATVDAASPVTVSTKESA